MGHPTWWWPLGEPPHGVGEFVSDTRSRLPSSLSLTRTGSADYMQGTRLNFKTKEDAIHFAEKQGEYTLCRVHNSALTLCQAGTTTCTHLVISTEGLP